MSTPVNLTVRQQQILWATIRHYIATAEPVGSKALVDEYNLSVSPATIRHSMGVLEKVGLLYQPYTSAGRVLLIPGIGYMWINWYYQQKK